MRWGALLAAGLALFLLALLARRVIHNLRHPTVRVLSVDLTSRPVRPIQTEPRAEGAPVFSSPVSAVSLGHGQYLVANYEHVFMLDQPSAQVNVLEVRDGLAGAVDQRRYPRTWNPAGLALTADRSRVVIANYTGDNLLVARLTEDHRTLVVEEEVKSPDLLGPENVALSSDGRYLVSANYTGGSFTGFKRDSSHWVQRWKVEAPNAHGIAVVGRYAFGSNLLGASIYKIDLETGRLLLKRGRPGWDPARLQLLYPTALASLDPESLLVTDARSGHVTVYATNNLAPLSYFGDNGPGYSHFNMPYGIGVDEDGFFVLSTFQDRIVFLDNHYQVRDQLAAEPGWKDADERFRDVVLGKTWTDYEDVRGCHFWLWGVWYHSGVGEIVPEPCTRRPRLYLPNRWDPLGFGRNYMFVQANDTARGLLLFSPQNRRAIYVRPLAQTIYCLPVDIPLDTWAVSGRLYSSRGEVGEDILAAAEALAQELENAREPGGRLGLQALFEKWVRIPNATPEQHKRITVNFRSEPGQRFLNEYLACETQRCDGDRLRRLAEEYAIDANRLRSVALDEYCLVQTLTNSFFGLPRAQSDCSDSSSP